MAYEQLGELVARSRHVVFFGGAGVSTESGIPDFRSAAGLYRAQQAYGAPPETLLSRGFFLRRPEVFFRYYRENLVHTQARPNRCHRALAALERTGKLTGVITQNIDGLHQMAGSRAVWELHGSIHRNHCMACGRAYPLQAVLDAPGVPTCACGGIVKPDVVLYGEPLDEDTLRGAQRALERSDLLIVGGTSLAVYPAAALVEAYGGPLALINRDATPQDNRADLVLHADLGEAMKQFLPATPL